jgi:hypothetical protein
MSWLISKALMNSLYLQEQEAAFLGENSLDGEQSVQSNGNNTQQAYCAPDKMTGFSRLSRFGMTYKPLTENRGEELLTLYREAFPVRTFPSLAEAQGLTEKVPQCGITWRGWLAKFDPDSYSWKTAQCSFIEESGECLATFPVSGLTRDGLLWEQTRLERPIKGTERGLWRTPDTGGGGDIWTSQTRPESSKEWSAHPNQIGRSSEQSKTLADTSSQDVQRRGKPSGVRQERDTPSGTGWWAIEPRVGRVADGVAARVDRLKAIGNGQVPQVVAAVWRKLNDF